MVSLFPFYPSQFLLKPIWFLERDDFMLQQFYIEFFTFVAFLGHDNFLHETSAQFSQSVNFSQFRQIRIIAFLFIFNLPTFSENI